MRDSANSRSEAPTSFAIILYSDSAPTQERDSRGIGRKPIIHHEQSWHLRQAPRWPARRRGTAPPRKHQIGRAHV